MRSYLHIASEVRSGSTYVAESIAYYMQQRLGYEFWHLTNEYLGDVDASTSPDQIVNAAHSQFLDRSGFATGKIMCKALSVLHKHAATSAEIQDTFFGDRSFWIVVRRRDKLRQAVSLATAKKSGVYHFYGDPSIASDNDVSISPVDVEAALKAIMLSDQYLEVFGNSLGQRRILSFFYEDFMKDNGKYLNLINKLCGFPHDPDVRPTMRLAKLTPTAQKIKSGAYDDFSSWFLKNYD